MSSKMGLFFVLFITLTLFGAGCRSNAPTPAAFQETTDAAIPEGWEEYNGTLFSLSYPSDWYAKEDTIESPDPVDLKRVFFDTSPISSDRESEPIYLAMLESWSGTTEEALARYSVVSNTALTINGQRVVRFTYGADFLGDTQPVAYVLENKGRIFLLQRFDGNPEYLETMLQTLEVR